MKLTTTEWGNLLLLEKEFKRRGENLSRENLMKLLHVPLNRARTYQFALENRDVIAFNPMNVEVYEDRTELILSDLHIPFHDEIAIEAALNYADGFRITDITLLGDFIDFYKISRFTKDPTERSVSEELAIGKAFLTMLTKRFPNAKIRYKMGNHEARLAVYIMSQAKEIYDLVDNLLETRLGLKELGIELITEPFRVGKLWHLHGHEKTGGSYNPEYATNVIWNYVFDHFIAGHFHRGQEKIYKRIDDHIFYGGIVGYLAKELDYAMLNKWTKGFAIVNYASDGMFRVRLHNIFNGQVM